jgi:carbonic anhydrase
MPDDRRSDADHPLAPRHDDRLADAIRRGASMEEIADLREPDARDPEEAILELKRGNARFFSGETHNSHLDANQRRAQIIEQTPFAVVLGCSDSRVPVETVFDVGLGDLFVTRVAGNVPDSAVLASIEYAVQFLKCRLVMVLGHEGCGAVAAALPDQRGAELPEHVGYLVQGIAPALQGMPRIRDKKARMREAVMHNVRYQVHRLRQDAVIRKAEESGRIRVVGGFYEIGSGAVDFLLEESELALDPGIIPIPAPDA